MTVPSTTPTANPTRDDVRPGFWLTGLGRRAPLLVMVCAVILIVVLVCALLNTLIAPKDPSFQILSLRGSRPGGDYPLGTDGRGRDVLSRLIVGARSAVLGPALAAVAVVLLGSAIGILAGYVRGWLDAVVMRWVDFMLAMPNLLIIMVVVGVIGGGYVLAIVMLVIFMVPNMARLVRGVVLQQRELPYVEAAQVLGVSRRRIMVGHLWPNVAPLAVAMSFLYFAVALVALSSLSFLGLGVPVGAADWGRMVVENRELLGVNPWCVVAPGLAIILTAVSMNVVGDWLFERFTSDSGRPE